MTLAMRFFYSLVVATATILASPALLGQSVFINEFHYDNSSTDTGEAIEIAGPAGTNVGGWRIVRYNGSDGAPYTTPAANPAGSDTFPANTLIPNTTGNGFGFLVINYTTNGLQNGAPDGFALVDNNNNVVQFLCYEGIFAASGTTPSTANPAAGMTCTDVGRSEPGNADGTSIRLAGTGSVYTDFAWQNPQSPTSFGQANAGQTFVAPSQPTLNINDVTLNEGNVGTTTFTFNVTLTAAATTAVTFNIATQDGTATVANNDYLASSLTSQSIAQGSTGPYQFSVTVNGDLTVEANENFSVLVTSIVGATAGKTTGVGTITNDDNPPVNCTPTHAISQVQGSGNTSPLVGQVVTVDGVVTAGKFNGFFVQEPDSSADGNPSTSEGIFVFTNNANAPTTGNFVCVTGTVTEFATSFGTITQLTSATTQTINTGNPLPAAIPLTTSFPLATGTIDQLERVENMRVSIGSVTAASGTTETGFENAAFFAVVTGVPVPFREPGIQAPLGVPSTTTKTIPPIPRFDANPELIRIDFRGQNQASGPAVTAGQTVTNVIGVMDFNSRGYELALDTNATPVITGPSTFTAIPQPAANQITAGHIALRNYTGTATQQAKAVRVVRDVLRYPDVLGVTEVNTLTSLTNLATAVNATQSGLNYVAYLGSGTGTQNVGFLVKSSRVTVVGTPGQILDNVTWNDPSAANPAQLHDRPPFLLQGQVALAGSGTFDFTVLMVHLRSLIDIESETPISAGGTEGDRTRTKRRLAAENIAQFLQQRQTTNPAERILVVGDFNAFQFNDGYVDVMGTLSGVPTPDAQVVQSTGDLINPNFINLVNTSKIAGTQKYSYIFGGSRQVLDHILVSQPLMGFVNSLVYGRTAAEFPESLASDNSRPERVTDHDPAIAYITLPNNPGQDITAKVRVSNTGLFFNGGLFSGFIRVTNTSGAALTGPLHVLIDEIAPGVTLTNATGIALGKPYITIPTASLNAGATAQVQVIYSNPGNVLINTVARVMQGSF